ncbi:MAG: transposase [Ketobacter sp.]
MRIEDMTVEQLLELNRVICDRIDYLQAKQDQNVLAQIHVGNQVSFKTNEGTVFGIIIKKNRKTVIVLTEDNRQWKLPPGALTIVKDV